MPWQKVAVVLGGAFRFDRGVPYQAQVEGDFGELFLTLRGIWIRRTSCSWTFPPLPA